MLVNGSVAQFYLSSNSPQGYLTYLNNLYDTASGWKAYILTGCMNVELSGYLKKAEKALEEAGEKVESIYSCHEPDKMIAVSFPRLHTCLVDGTPPNTVIPEYPGLTEIFVNVGDYLDEKKLEGFRENIMLFTARIRSSSDRAHRFLAAASSLTGDTLHLALECTDMQKLENYATHLARRDFYPTGLQGNETRRFLTAVTPEGLTNHYDSVLHNYNRIYELDDEYGIGKLFLNKLRCAALAAGYDVIACPCPLFPDGKPEHLLIPSLSLAFVTTGHTHPAPSPNERIHRIHMRRFIDRDAIKLKRPRISFNRRASRELIDEAVLLLADAQASRKMIQSYYTEALDAASLGQKIDALTTHLLTLIPPEHPLPT